jgi:hypothetical protein
MSQNAEDLRRLIVIFRQLQESIAAMQAGISLAIVELEVILEEDKNG